MFYVFGITILLGAAMAFLRLKGKPYPAWGLSIAHLLFAFVGVLWLLVIILAHSDKAIQTGPTLALFFVVVILGFILLIGYHALQRPLPIAVMALHGLLAIAVVLWLFL